MAQRVETARSFAKKVSIRLHHEVKLARRLVRSLLVAPHMHLMQFNVLEPSLGLDRLKTVVHVGAHKGQEVGLYRALGAEVVYLIEPQLDLVQRLKKRYGGSRDIVVVDKALGAKAEQREIYEEVEDSFNGNASASLLKPLKHLDDYPGVKFKQGGHKKVEVVTLDSLGIDRICLLCIDVQGFEMEVLRGGSQTLLNTDSVIVEFWQNEAYRGVPKLNDLIVELEGKGLGLKQVVYDRTFGNALFQRVRPIKGC